MSVKSSIANTSITLIHPKYPYTKQPPELKKRNPSQWLTVSTPPELTKMPFLGLPASRLTVYPADLRDATQVGQNPTFATTVSKEEAILGDKAVGGMDDDKDHTVNVVGGLKSYADPHVSFALGLSLYIPSPPD